MHAHIHTRNWCYLEERVAEELGGPEEELRREDDPARGGERPEAGGEAVAGGPAGEAERGGGGPGAPVHERVEAAKGAGGGEAEAERDVLPAERAVEPEERRREAERQERREEDGPDAERVDEDVGRVAVVRRVEGVVSLQVEQLRHWHRLRLECFFFLVALR